MFEKLAGKAIAEMVAESARLGVRCSRRALDEITNRGELSRGAWADVQHAQGVIDGILKAAGALGCHSLGNESDDFRIFRSEKAMIGAWIRGQSALRAECSRSRGKP